MTFVSVTRLRLRGLRSLPGFGVRTWRSQRAAASADGFVEGHFGAGPRLTVWTVTAWRDEAAMRAYRDSGAHRQAMPFLFDACDEAAVRHWSIEGLPAPTEAVARIVEGRLTSLKHPSAAHAAGQAWPDGRLPRFGPRVEPRA